MSEVVIAILAKDKAYCLDFYLKCISNQTFDKSKTHLYIRTNDNRDNTEDILDRFVEDNSSKYASVYYDKSSVSKELKQFGEHEWNSKRFDVLAKIRQDSIDYAISKKAHYFVVDCDNFITKTTLSDLYANKEFKVIAPLLRLSKSRGYANYHNEVTENGYFKSNDNYQGILESKNPGIIEVDLVHCTYFIEKSVLDSNMYSDDTGRYEYVIFSDKLRQRAVSQYIDNTKFFGFLFLNDQMPIPFEQFVSENWQNEYYNMQ